MLNCGITGHSGVLGSELTKKKIGLRFIKFNGDITKKKSVDNWIKSHKIDIIIHLAAIVPVHLVKKNYFYANSVNFDGTKKIVDSIINNKLQLKWFFFHPLHMCMLFQKN